MIKSKHSVCEQHTISLPTQQLYIAYYNSHARVVGVTLNKFGKLIWLTTQVPDIIPYSKC